MNLESARSAPPQCSLAEPAALAMKRYDTGGFTGLRKAIGISLGLYIFSTWFTMAGMEFMGWLTFALTAFYIWKNPKEAPASFAEVVSKSTPWRALIGFWLITAISIFVNGNAHADKFFVIGSQRWILLLLSTTYALSLAPLRFKYYRFFLWFVGLVAVYAIFQSFTGIDLVRMSSAEPNRAVQPLDIRTELRMWRSAGFFGSPMGYVYIAGMYSCLPLAVGMLAPSSMKKLKAASFAVFFLVALSLITTYVRGAWIGMTIAYLLMAWLAARRFFIWICTLSFAAFIGLFFGLIQFRVRFLSLFNLSYASNGDRLGLWKMNWRMFLDYPIFGIGYGENEVRSCDYVDCTAVPRPFTGHAHNNYLQVLSGLGLTGFILYMFIIGFFLWLTYRLWMRLPKELIWARALTLACLGGQVLLHIGGFTECNFKAGATNHNLMVVYGIVASLSFLQFKGVAGLAYPPNPLFEKTN